MLYTAVALFVGTSLASSCNAKDKSVWENSVKAKFHQDEKHCALRCAGANPCTGDCISNTYGLSHDCGQCFGGLSECVVRHCVVYPGNCGVNENGEACKKCTNQYCTPAFESCTGFTPPSASAVKLEVAANECCEDGCGTDGWQTWTTKAQYCPMACGYCYNQAAELQAPAKLTEASWCQYIGSAIKPLIPECASAKATLGVQLEEASWCKYIGSAVKPFIPECSSAKLGAQLSAVPFWCQYIGAEATKFVTECQPAALEYGVNPGVKSLSASGAFQF